jgi:hypothetical protein
MKVICTEQQNSSELSDAQILEEAALTDGRTAFPYAARANKVNFFHVHSPL